MTVFLWSFLGWPVCCTEASGGGPGRISVARLASPSKCEGWAIGTLGSMYAGTLSTDAMTVEGRVCE